MEKEEHATRSEDCWGRKLVQSLHSLSTLVLICLYTVITDPDDKNFDLEAYLTMKSAENT